jgi:hypothetical protein
MKTYSSNQRYSYLATETLSSPIRPIHTAAL